MNPLHDISRSLGLSVKSIAALTGTDAHYTAAALAENPVPTLAEFIRICEKLDIRFKLAVAPSLRFWVDATYVDSLYKDDTFRRSHGLHTPFPVTRRDYRDLVLKFKKRGTTLRKVAHSLEQNYIPTWESGARYWNSGTIEFFTKRWTEDSRYARPQGKPNETFIADWREFVFDAWLTCPDPAWMVRYGLSQRQEGDRLILETTEKMPACIRLMVEAAMANAGWMAGKWGLIEPTSTSP